MKLIKPYYEIISDIDGESILKEIELVARTCYKSEDKIEYIDDESYLEKGEPCLLTAKSARVFIYNLISRGHEAMLEFGGTITVKFICNRGVSHELVKHRIVSFAQESTRYCNYSKDEHIQFIIPNWMNLKEGIVYNFDNIDTINGSISWLLTLIESERVYNHLLQLGWSPQQARSVLPNSLKTEINVSANIREWRHIFRLRTAKVAHPQMRELMCPLLDEFKRRIPILFNDINYDV